MLIIFVFSIVIYFVISFFILFLFEPLYFFVFLHEVYFCFFFSIHIYSIVSFRFTLVSRKKQKKKKVLENIVKPMYGIWHDVSLPFQEFKFSTLVSLSEFQSSVYIYTNICWNLSICRFHTTIRRTFFHKEKIFFSNIFNSYLKKKIIHFTFTLSHFTLLLYKWQNGTL